MPVTRSLMESFQSQRSFGGSFGESGAAIEVHLHQFAARPVQGIENDKRVRRQVNLVGNLTERLPGEGADGLLTFRDVMVFCGKLADGLLTVGTVDGDSQESHVCSE